MSNHIEEFPLSEIHETYAALRLTNSRAQAAMVRSLATHGQLTPVVCIRRPEVSRTGGWLQTAAFCSPFAVAGDTGPPSGKEWRRGQSRDDC